MTTPAGDMDIAITHLDIRIENGFHSRYATRTLQYKPGKGHPKTPYASDTLAHIERDIPGVVAVAYGSGGLVHLLLDKTKDTESVICEAVDRFIDTSPDSETWTVKTPDPVTLNVRAMLLLCAMHGTLFLPSMRDNTVAACSNLSGSFHVFHKSWKTGPRQVVAMRLDINQDDILTAHVTTFKRREDASGRERSGACYVLEGARLVRASDKDKTSRRTLYVKGPDPRHRSTIPLLKTSITGAQTDARFQATLDAIGASRAGVVHDVIEQFNARYRGVASLAMRHVRTTRQLLSGDTIMQRTIMSMPELAGARITLVANPDELTGCTRFAVTEHRTRKMDVTLEDAHAIIEACRNAIGHWLDRYAPDANLTVASQSRADAWNIMLVHDKAFYQHKKQDTETDGATRPDPHHVYEDMVVQHMTLEDCLVPPSGKTGRWLVKEDKATQPSSFVTMIMTNCATKADMVAGHIADARWRDVVADPDGHYTFCVRCLLPKTKKENRNRYGFLVMDIDHGQIRFTNDMESCWPEYGREDKLKQALQAAYEKSRDHLTPGEPELAVMDTDENINIIINSEIQPWPGVDAAITIQHDKQHRYERETDPDKKNRIKPSMRNAKEKPLVYGPVTDFNTLVWEDSSERKRQWSAYYVGLPSTNMRPNVERGCPIRIIDTPDDSPLFVGRFYPTMLTGMVRVKHGTVHPTPMKYLREYGYQVEVRLANTETDASQQ